MKVIEKRNISIPNLNIESFGVCLNSNDRYNTHNYMQYYIASLEYKIKSLFGNYTKTVYLPILFYNEKEIQNIMTYYNDIYFVIRFKYEYSSSKHYSDLYHISNFVDFEKIYKKELELLKSTPDAHGIDFVVRNYKGYDIVINTQYQCYEYNICSPLDIEYLYTKNNEKDCLSLIKEHYNVLPVLASYSIKRSSTEEYNSIYNVETFKKITEYIDKLDNENQELQKKLDSMYSKKSFKLVEN